MIANKSSAGIASRENHSHGPPIRRNKARYASALGRAQRFSRKGEGGSGRNGGLRVISSVVTIVASWSSGTAIRPMSRRGAGS